MSTVSLYRKKPVEVFAIELRAYGDFVRARDWINANGGSAAYSSGAEGGDYLIVSTLEGNMEAGTGWFIIQGVKGEFYPCAGDIFSLTYEAVEPEFNETLTGTGSYVVGRPDGRTSLVGGAAKRLRSDGTDGSWAGD